MGSVLLDTTVLIDVLRGRQGAVARLQALRRAGDDVHTSTINVEEIVRGLKPDDEAAARTLFEGMGVVSLVADHGWRAGIWRRSYAAQGTTLSQADCLIAAAATSVGGRLATGNPKDFPMPELTVEHWPAGE